MIANSPVTLTSKTFPALSLLCSISFPIGLIYSCDVGNNEVESRQNTGFLLYEKQLQRFYHLYVLLSYFFIGNVCKGNNRGDCDIVS